MNVSSESSVPFQKKIPDQLSSVLCVKEVDITDIKAHELPASNENANLQNDTQELPENESEKLNRCNNKSFENRKPIENVLSDLSISISEMTVFQNCIKKVKKLCLQDDIKRCNTCYMKFSTIQDLAMHELCHVHINLPNLNIHNYTCPLCDLYFTSSAACLNHIASVCMWTQSNYVNQKKMNMSQEEKYSSTIFKFNIHLLCHNANTNPIPCKYCAEEYNNYRNVWSHMVSNHITPRYINSRYHFCPICNFAIFGRSILLEHIAQTHLYCKYCSKRFNDIKVYFQHVVGCKTEEVVKTSVPCLFCGKRMKKLYVEHLSTCNNLRKQLPAHAVFNKLELLHVKCTICQRIKRSCEIDYHILNHSKSPRMQFKNTKTPTLKLQRHDFHFANADTTYDKLVCFVRNGTVVKKENKSTISVCNKEVKAIFDAIHFNDLLNRKMKRSSVFTSIDSEVFNAKSEQPVSNTKLLRNLEISQTNPTSDSLSSILKSENVDKSDSEMRMDRSNRQQHDQILSIEERSVFNKPVSATLAEDNNDKICEVISEISDKSELTVEINNPLGLETVSGNSISLVDSEPIIAATIPVNNVLNSKHNKSMECESHLNVNSTELDVKEDPVQFPQNSSNEKNKSQTNIVVKKLKTTIKTNSFENDTSSVENIPIINSDINPSSKHKRPKENKNLLSRGQTDKSAVSFSLEINEQFEPEIVTTPLNKSNSNDVNSDISKNLFKTSASNKPVTRKSDLTQNCKVNSSISNTIKSTHDFEQSDLTEDSEMKNSKNKIEQSKLSIAKISNRCVLNDKNRNSNKHKRLLRKLNPRINSTFESSVTDNDLTTANFDLKQTTATGDNSSTLYASSIKEHVVDQVISFNDRKNELFTIGEISHTSNCKIAGSIEHETSERDNKNDIISSNGNENRISKVKILNKECKNVLENLINRKIEKFKNGQATNSVNDNGDMVNNTVDSNCTDNGDDNRLITLQPDNRVNKITSTDTICDTKLLESVDKSDNEMEMDNSRTPHSFAVETSCLNKLLSTTLADDNDDKNCEVISQISDESELTSEFNSPLGLETVSVNNISLEESGPIIISIPIDNVLNYDHNIGLERKSHFNMDITESDEKEEPVNSVQNSKTNIDTESYLKTKLETKIFIKKFKTSIKTKIRKVNFGNGTSSIENIPIINSDPNSSSKHKRPKENKNYQTEKSSVSFSPKMNTSFETEIITMPLDKSNSNDVNSGISINLFQNSVSKPVTRVSDLIQTYKVDSSKSMKMKSKHDFKQSDLKEHSENKNSKNKMNNVKSSDQSSRDMKLTVDPKQLKPHILKIKKVSNFDKLEDESSLKNATGAQPSCDKKPPCSLYAKNTNSNNDYSSKRLGCKLNACVNSIFESSVTDDNLTTFNSDLKQTTATGSTLSASIKEHSNKNNSDDVNFDISTNLFKQSSSKLLKRKLDFEQLCNTSSLISKKMKSTHDPKAHSEVNNYKSKIKQSNNVLNDATSSHQCLRDLGLTIDANQLNPHIPKIKKASNSAKLKVELILKNDKVAQSICNRESPCLLNNKKIKTYNSHSGKIILRKLNGYVNSGFEPSITNVGSTTPDSDSKQTEATGNLSMPIKEHTVPDVLTVVLNVIKTELSDVDEIGNNGTGKNHLKDSYVGDHVSNSKIASSVEKEVSDSDNKNNDIKCKNDNDGNEIRTSEIEILNSGNKNVFENLTNIHGEKFTNYQSTTSGNGNNEDMINDSYDAVNSNSAQNGDYSKLTTAQPDNFVNKNKNSFVETNKFSNIENKIKTEYIYTKSDHKYFKIYNKTPIKKFESNPDRFRNTIPKRSIPTYAKRWMSSVHNEVNRDTRIQSWMLLNNVTPPRHGYCNNSGTNNDDRKCYSTSNNNNNSSKRRVNQHLYNQHYNSHHSNNTKVYCRYCRAEFTSDFSLSIHQSLFHFNYTRN